ncbi:MAG: FAD-binding oxidoreductase [Litoreibacter sp.]|nr:FAD-binding oxidoreductase [Litoreibacter sp.]
MRLAAKRLPVQPGPAAWNALLGARDAQPALEGKVNVDVAVIGAGFAGLSAARRLAQNDPTLRVAVLEAGEIAEGPAGRNSGFMIDLPHDLASDSYLHDDASETHLNRSAIAFAKEVAAEIGMGRDVFDPCGKVNAAASARSDQHNRDYAEHLAARNEPYRLLDARDMQELTGTEFYTSGLFTPGTVVIQPAAYIRGLAGVLPASVTLYENSPVTSLERNGTWRLNTPNGSVTSPKVILANNGHAESFGLFRRQLMHVFTYASMTESLPEAVLGGEPTWGVTPSEPMGTTVRRINGPGGDRIVIRSRFTFNPSMQVSDAALARAGKAHDRKFADRFPMLRGVKMDYRWAGHLCLTRNNVAVHGEVEPGLFSAICQNGLGTVKGTLAGMSAADLVLGRENDVTRALTGADEPQKLPPEPIASIGANAVLKWKERRAGRE